MEEISTGESAILRRRDLDRVVGAAGLRLPLRAPEWQRLQEMRRVVDAASELTRALTAHTQCVLVNCGGRFGSGDLDAETDALFGALQRYADVLREVGTRYADALETPLADVERLLDGDAMLRPPARAC